MGAVGLDEEAVAGVSKTNARRLRSRKHFGNASSHFLVATAAAKRNQSRNRVTVSSSIRIIKRSPNRREKHGRSVNLSQSK